jgi:hypothetical protein
MKSQGGVDNVGAHLPDEEGELVAGRVQVVGQDGAVDGEERFVARKTDRKCREMALSTLFQIKKVSIMSM